MQSGAALHVLDRQPDQAKPALTAIKQLSKQTLDELRATVGVLRDDEDAPLAPTPGLDQLDTLVDNARGAGVTVNVDCEPRPAPLPVAVDVAAFRIVQEALTNVMRHAGSNVTATVTVRHTADEVRVEVVDDGRGAASSADAERRGGHGIAGMSERAITVGGHVAAGPHPGGGFRVLARLPLSGIVVGSSTGATP
jgi:signal transduction histidine kinase